MSNLAVNDGGIVNGYLSLAEWKKWYFDGTAQAVTVEDMVIEKFINAASRTLDRAYNQRFYTTNEDETRVMTPLDYCTVILDMSVNTITTLKTDADGDRTYETTWASTDYDVFPANAAADGEPYSMIHTAPNGRYSFPWQRNSIQLVGRFGWATIPPEVEAAMFILATRLFKRKDTIYGVMGSADMGQLMVIAKTDPDVKMLMQGLDHSLI